MKHRILLIDNYDSFTYNLVQALSVLDAEVWVHRHDQITVDAAFALAPTHVVISPGPGRPEEAGISMDVLRICIERRIPTLGVCLGHQALGAVSGGIVRRANKPMHGKASLVSHDGTGLFTGISAPMEVARYHSLIVADEGLPPTLRVTARTAAGEIMAMSHTEAPVQGVQFHPESVLTPEGPRLLANFLEGR